MMTEQSLASTREGDIRWYYSREVEPRPFSRFSQIESERKANEEWSKRATFWGNERFDKNGHRLT